MKLIITVTIMCLLSLGLSQIEASSSTTYDGGNTWHHSNGSTSTTYDGGRTWYHSDGSSSVTYDGNTYYHRPPGTTAVKIIPGNSTNRVIR